MGGVLLNWAGERGEALKGPAGGSEGSEGVHPAAGYRRGRAGGRGPQSPLDPEGLLRASRPDLSFTGLPRGQCPRPRFPGRSSESRRPALAARGPGLAIPAAGPQLSLGLQGWPGPGHQLQDAPGAIGAGGRSAAPSLGSQREPQSCPTAVGECGGGSNHSACRTGAPPNLLDLLGSEPLGGKQITGSSTSSKGL